MPSVTIGIPVLNEEEHIERVIKGFLNSDYEPLVEILVADGGSTDNTCAIINEIAGQDERVILIHNPEHYQSHALNKMIDQARGEVFLRADGHCVYEDDYLTKNLEVFLETKARNAGGAQRNVAQNRVQAGIAIAGMSFLGNGGARYMDENYEGFADTVFLGCFWTRDLKMIGGFSTDHVTNQDSELNLRLTEHFGPCVYVSPHIKSWYYPRSSYLELFKQYFRYGRGRCQTILQHPANLQKRGLSPFLFLLFMLGYGLAELITLGDLYYVEVVTVLTGIVLGETLRVTVTQKKKFEQDIWKGKGKSPGLLFLWAGSVTSILTMLFAHFSGFAYQFIRKVIGRVKGW